MQLRIGVKNSMYWAELKDNDGDISAGVFATAAQMHKWCYEHNISRELWLSTKLEPEKLTS